MAVGDVGTDVGTGRPGPRQRRGKSPPAGRRRRPCTTSPTTSSSSSSSALDSCATVVRAASACRRWCRVVAGAEFLSRFGSLRALRLAGHYHTVDPFFDAPAGGMPVLVPSPTMAAASANSRDFLPDSKTWELADSRGSLLLLFKNTSGLASWPGYCYFADQLVVCEPLTRRHQRIITPAGLRGKCIGLFLLDGDDDDDNVAISGRRRIGMSNFKIVAVLHEVHTWQYGRGPLACVFSSGSDGGWRVQVQQSSSSDSSITVPDDHIESISFAGRAGGSIYWLIGLGEDGAILVLDEATAGFSVVTFPESLLRSYDQFNFRVTGGEDGALRAVHLVANELKVFARRHGRDEWVLENLLQLPEATRGLPGHEDRFFRTHILVTPQEKTWPFSVDIETMEVERARERNKYAGTAFPYELPWPPVLVACAERGRGRSRR